MSLQKLYADETISMTDLKRDPSLIDAFKKPVAILKRDQVRAYIIPTQMMADLMETMKAIERLEDKELSQLANAAIEELDTGKTHRVSVSFDDL